MLEVAVTGEFRADVAGRRQDGLTRLKRIYNF
jgi:hypothetical protein